MSKGDIIYWGSLFCWWIIISIFSISLAKSCENNSSSPVEEMYHRQLVVTLDSILDARFGADYYEEDIDNDTIKDIKSTFYNTFAPLE